MVHLGTELFSLQHEGVEVAQSEQYSLRPVGTINHKRTLITIWVKVETTRTQFASKKIERMNEATSLSITTTRDGKGQESMSILVAHTTFGGVVIVLVPKKKRPQREQ